jgi:hypothetical protein
VAAGEFREPEEFQPSHAGTGAEGNGRQENRGDAWIDDSAGTIGHLYGMETTPHMFVIDKTARWFTTARLTTNRIPPTTRPRRATTSVKPWMK